MTKAAPAAAAAPPAMLNIPAQVHPVPMTALLRGPVVLILSLWSLVLPALLNSSLRTQLSVLALFLGTILTVLDCAAVVQDHLHTLKRRMRERVGSVVLDDVLRSVFAPDNGWLAVLVGTWVGTAGMYALPLDEEQRVRLFGSGLAGVDPTADPEEVLLRPGGLMRLLPDGWRGDDGNVKDLSEDSVSTKIGIDNDDNGDVPIASVDRDMRWDQDNDADCATVDVTEDSDSSQHAPTFVNDDDAEPVLGHPQTERLPRPSISTSRTIQPEDPATAAAAVISELIGRLFDRSLQSMDGRSIQKVGIASALALTLQLRRSASARATLWAALQGTAALGLAGTAVGAVALLETRERRRRTRSCSAVPRPSDASQSNSTFDPGASPPTSGTDDVDSPTLGVIINHGRNWFQSFVMSAKSPAFVRRIVEDEQFRRRVQGAVAVLILFYFRRRRRRMLQQPSSRGGLYA